MEEVLRSLIEDGALVKAGESWITTRSVTEIDVPDTLAGVLTARIDRLDEQVKRAIQVAAVIGRVFHRAVLEAVSDDIGDLDRHLTALVSGELIRERSSNEGDKEYIFKHVLIQETAYNNLLIQQRRIYHKKIADHLAQLYWLRGEEFASTAAHHYEQGEVWGRALTYNQRAAEAARNSFDNATAVHFYTKALDITGRLTDIDNKSLIDLYRGRGNLLKRLGKIEEARLDFERVLQLAEADQNQSIQMRALGELGKLHEGYEDFSQAGHYFERALELARVVDDKPGLVDALNQLADFTFNMGDLSKTGPYLHEALQIAEKLDNKQRINSCQDGLSAVMLYQGEINASIARFEELAQTWRNLGSYQELMRTYFYLASAYRLHGDYQRSDQICHESLEILDRFGDLNWVSQFRSMMAQNALAHGNFAEAEIHLVEMILVAERLGKGIWRSLGLTQQGYAQMLQGRMDEGWLKISQGVELAESIGSPMWASRARIISGVAERLRGNLAESIAILEREAQFTQQIGLAPDEVMALSELLETYVLAGEWQKLSQSIKHLRELTDACDMRASQAKTFWITAQLAHQQGETTAAIKVLQQGKEIAAEIGHRFQEIVVDLFMVRLYLAQGQLPMAEDHLAQAEAGFEQITHSLKDKASQRRFGKSNLGRELRKTQKKLGLERV
jgi:predicted ATPase